VEGAAGLTNSFCTQETSSGISMEVAVVQVVVGMTWTVGDKT
jgi:hypothetical protein